MFFLLMNEIFGSNNFFENVFYLGSKVKQTKL